MSQDEPKREVKQEEIRLDYISASFSAFIKAIKEKIKGATDIVLIGDEPPVVSVSYYADSNTPEGIKKAFFKAYDEIVPA